MQKNNELHTFLKDKLKEIRIAKNKLNQNSILSNNTVTGFSDFFVGTPITISYHFSNQILKLNKEKIYFSLYEKNTNFDKAPESEHTLVYGNRLEFNYDFIFNGQVTCEIIIIFFEGLKKIGLVDLKANGQNKLTTKIPENAESYRVILRLNGNGDFVNQQFKVNQTIEKEISKPVISYKSENKSILSLEENIEEFKRNIGNLKYNRKVNANNLKVASILDEFTHNCFKYDCELLPLTKDGWKEELDRFNPDFLFVESAWQGNFGEWAYEVVNLHINTHRTELKALTDYCKSQGIKTVFWDKEGVENFEWFKVASTYFDYIFTADENNIKNFKEYTKSEQVYPLAFAAQPQIHNPIYKNRNYLGQVAFAGSYYSNKHDLRKRDIDQLVEPAIRYGVQIFDRYFGSDPLKLPNNQWPDKFKRNIVGKLNYTEMVEAYKNYDIFLNVNSVQDSKYMFARRVFEVLASGTMVISGPSVGVENHFGSAVPIARTLAESNNLLKMYSNNEHVRAKLVKTGQREVLKNHTYKNRLQEICRILNVGNEITNLPKVTIVTSTQREEFIENLFSNISSQTYENFELVIVLNKDNMDKEKWESKFSSLPYDVKVIKIDESKSLGHCLNQAISISEGSIIAKFDDDDYYAPNYLIDMVLAMDYSNASIVGKSEHYVYLESENLLMSKKVGAGEEIYSEFVSGATLIMSKKMLDDLGGFADRSRGEDSDLLRRAKDAGYKVYSNGKENFCLVRRSDKSSHTWQVDATELIRNSESHSYTTDYRTPVTY